jgi:CxxC-x17-CxxC domain-containing protein
MGNFQGGNGGGGYRGGGGGGFRGGNGGGRSNFRGGDREVTMHKAICDECHKECQVPFRPSGDKPIYCNECFSAKRGNDDRGPRKDFGGDRGPRRDFSDRPTQPSFSKPAIPAQNDSSKQLAEINTKLDRLIGTIEKLTQPKAETVKAPAVKAITKKVDVKAIVKKAVAKKVLAKKK